MAKEGEKKTGKRAAAGGGWPRTDLFTLFSEIVRNMKEGVVLVGAGDRKIIYANPEFGRQFGYKPGELVGMPVFALNAPADRPPEEYARKITTTLRSQGRWQGDIKGLRKDGSVIWTRTSITIFPLEGKGTVLLSIHQDITERKKAEEDVWFRAELLDNANDAIHVMDTDGNIVYCNETMARHTGYSREELVGMNISKLSPGRPPFARPREKGVFADGPLDARFEALVTRKDGTTFPSELHARALLAGDRRLILSVGRDISYRKRMEKALKDSEANFRNIFNSALDGLLVADAKTMRFVMCNKRICEMLGYTAYELQGLAIRDLQRAEDLPNTLKIVAEQLRGELELASDMPVKRKDGSIFYADINSTLVTFGRQKFLIGNFRDVTERRRTELALKKSETLHRALIDTTDTGYVVIDEKGRVLDANRQYLDFIGYAGLEEIRGRSVLDWTAKYDLKKNDKAVEACARDGQVRNLEIDYVHRSGGIVPIEINATVVDVDGKPQILSICRDISARRKGVQALNDSLKELAEQKKLLEQKNIAFQEVIKSIELEKTAIKDNVARNVSELVLPILKRLKLTGAPRKYLDLLQKNLAALTASFGREITEKARRLTPREIEVCNMIKEGLTSKEIAGLIGASSQTVDKHRKNIRKKLGLNVKKSNLVSFLRSFK